MTEPVYDDTDIYNVYGVQHDEGVTVNYDGNRFESLEAAEKESKIYDHERSSSGECSGCLGKGFTSHQVVFKIVKESHWMKRVS
jgi:hypothetical protein